MTLPEFTNLVAEMRAAQKQYFRDRNNLPACKSLERRVDQAVEEIQAGPAEPALFGDTSPSALAKGR